MFWSSFTYLAIKLRKCLLEVRIDLKKKKKKKTL